MFWNLTDTGIERRLADSPENEDLNFEEFHCPIEPRKHFRLGRRTSPVSVVLPNLKLQDLVWKWGGDLLAQERVVKLFEERRFTGYEATRVRRVEFRGSTKKPPQLWEIIVKGSGGMASLESGTKAVRVCPGCGLTDYSRITDPSKLIDLNQWDGTDFFRVDPVDGFIFVTDRVIESLRENSISGWKARSLSEMQSNFDNVLLIDLPAVN